MEYKYLGKSSLKVSPICLGAMMFGGATDETTSKRIIDKSYDQGINFNKANTAIPIRAPANGNPSRYTALYFKPVFFILLFIYMF